MPPRLSIAWRFAALGGLTSGLAASPLAAAGDPPAGRLIAVAAVAGLALAVARPRTDALPIHWLGGVAVAAALAGVGVGVARLAAIDRAAYAVPAGTRVEARGFVEAVPRRADGEIRVRVVTADGRLLVEAPEPAGELRVGREVRASGVLREPVPWEAAYLARAGVARVLEAERLRSTGRRRGGLAALGDRVRDRAEAALERGTPPAEAALLRGFVLGEDDRIAPQTVDDFKRSGLAHLLAVSGQNVVLLALLATPILALLGVPLRARLLCLLALIAVYVPVAGAGPSIQRAGVMGAAGVVAALASRPRSRWYALLLAALATLAVNPRASGDAGWQLSFAAVIGILLLGPPLREAILGGRRRTASGARLALAEGAAVTLAATLATGPLIAHHFEAVSLASVPANLLALPAVAPVMWLGMLAAAAGQVSWIPVEPVTWLAGLLAAYVAQVADWLAAPDWAQATVRLPSTVAVAVAYGVLAVGAGVAVALGRRRHGLRPKRALVVAFTLAVLALPTLLLRGPGGAVDPLPSGPGLRIRVLDVGQGDAILLDPEPGEPVLVDAGPADGGAGERLRELGIEHLAALAVTHDQADHSGGVTEVLAEIPVDALLYGEPSMQLLAAARAGGVPARQIAAGDRLAAGRLEVEVLWPPRELVAHGAEDPNQASLVLLARWRKFEILLTGDAEAELAPVDPGPVDVLKVAHHGSADAALETLLDRSAPRLALISVGDANPYGHPSPETLAALSEDQVPAMRTDLDGELAVEVHRNRWEAISAR